MIHQTKTELTIAQKEKDSIVQQLQTKLAKMHTKLDERVFKIQIISTEKSLNFIPRKFVLNDYHLVFIVILLLHVKLMNTFNKISILIN
jgi:hypothetical protein